MRLNTRQRRELKQQLGELLGHDCELLLFGSRLDDSAKGGDVDLLVKCSRPVERKAWTAARLAARAERVLDGRKVDVLLIDPLTPLQPIHQAALAEGEVLRMPHRQD